MNMSGTSKSFRQKKSIRYIINVANLWLQVSLIISSLYGDFFDEGKFINDMDQYAANDISRKKWQMIPNLLHH